MTTTSSPPQTATVVCLSDTHNFLCRDLPAGDVLIHAGDFTTTGMKAQVLPFLDWFQAQPHAVKVLIPGNHETTLHKEFYDRHWRDFHGRKQDVEAIQKRIQTLAPDVIFLDGVTATDVVLPNGLKLFGSPWTPAFNDWAFGYDGDVDVWGHIPADTDIVVTHGPPLGILDACEDGRHVGCPHLLRHITERVKPKLHVFGHIHHSAGVTTVGDTQFVNASICNEDYDVEHAPRVVVVPLPLPATTQLDDMDGGVAGIVVQ